MKKIIFLLLIIVMVLCIMPRSGYAIPAFARKHGFNCNMCHAGYPKLNDFGQRFRENGYQIPGQEGKEKTVFEIAPPISIRTTTGMSAYANGTMSTFGFNLYGLDLLAAGVMHKNISFMFIYTPRIDEPSATFRGPGNSDNPSQVAALESSNIVFSNLVKNKLNIRIGRFEPAYEAISSKRSYYLFAPYEIYDFASPANPLTFSDNQIGIEATGHFKNGFKYAFGFINGNGANPDNNKAKDFYFNLFKTFGPGDGQSAGQRVGVFMLYGWQPRFILTDNTSPFGETNGTGNRPYYRAGFDGSLNWKNFNLQVLYLYGADDKELAPITMENYKYSGGFVEFDYATLANNRLILSALYNWVRPPSYDAEHKIDGISALARYYMGSWKALNVVFHTEFGYRQTGKTNPLKEKLFSALIDFDF